MEHVERVWEFPPHGWVKVNVHSEFVQNAPEGHRDETRHLLKLTYGTIPGLTNMNSALWAILVGMRRGFQDEHFRVIIETDNAQAYRECKYYEEEGIPPHTRHTFRFILSRLKDKNSTYDLKLVNSQRNGVVRRLATLGRETMHDINEFEPDEPNQGGQVVQF